MKVVFIGAGNVATHMATELYKHDFEIVQVYSRTLESASLLAQQVGALPIKDITSVINDADLYIFSVKDSVLKEVASQLSTNNGLWLHTAGSMPVDIFADYSCNYGVIYPFQTFSKGRFVDWKTIPIFIESTNKENLNKIKNIAAQLSEKVIELSSDKRKYIHLTGVFACNFVNHMYVLSEEILKKSGLPFDIALPLIDETTAKIHTINPWEAQTGPAVRFDENVMQKHLSLIDDESIKDIYQSISQSIHKYSKEIK